MHQISCNQLSNRKRMGEVMGEEQQSTRPLRFDLYSGYAGDKTHTEKDVLIQLKDEPVEDLVTRLVDTILSNVQQFYADDKGGEDD